MTTVKTLQHSQTKLSQRNEEEDEAKIISDEKPKSHSLTPKTHSIMASISALPPILLRTNPTSLPFSSSPSLIVFFRSYKAVLHTRFRSLKAGSEGERAEGVDALSPDLLRKPVISHVDVGGGEESDKAVVSGASSKNAHVNERFLREEKKEENEEWVDWEDQILEDTVPLVGFVRMLLHSGKYESGAKLSAEHEKTILERLLPYHPEADKKIGCGVDCIKVDNHPEFSSSRCLFIVRKDGESVDFSYWKCIKGLIKKNYPLYADSFILRHFRRRRRGE